MQLVISIHFLIVLPAYETAHVCKLCFNYEAFDKKWIGYKWFLFNCTNNETVYTSERALR